MVDHFIPYYPSVHDDEFAKKIASKKEFADLKLGPEEPDAVGGLLAIQRFMQRFISPHTPYDRMLLAHLPGVGKTCTASAIVEILKSENPRKALVIVTGAELRNTFRNEIRDTCAKGIYTTGYRVEGEGPKETQTRAERERTIDSRIREVYDITTLTDLINRKVSPEDLQGRVIIVDEAHIYHPQRAKKKKSKTDTDGKKSKTDSDGKKSKAESGESEVKKYNDLHRLLHEAKDSRVLLMTGTPIWDEPSNIAYLMNLILDEDNQINPKTFDKTFFPKGKLNTEALAPYLRGRVSYLRPLSDIVVTDMGKTKPYTEHIKIWPDIMSKFQTENTKRAGIEKKTAKGAEGGAVFQTAKIAANMVLPLFDGDTPKPNDGYYGSNVDFYFKVNKNQNGYDVVTKHAERLKAELTFSGLDGEGLSKYSAKFASLISQLKDNPNQVFLVYIKEVHGPGGAFVLGKCLEYTGYGPYKTGGNKPKYVILTSGTKDRSHVEILKDINVGNARAEKAQVVIVTKAASVGLTVKNVRHIHILSPHWNMSELIQAIARGIRYGSHDALPEKERNVKIYRHAAINNDFTQIKDSYPIDLYTYSIAEQKDYKSFQIIRLMKEMSVDCSITYGRNVLSTDVDGSRECDYTKCNYTCDGMVPDKTQPHQNVWTYKNQRLDRSTYMLYYASDDIKDITARIVNVFKQYFSIDLESLKVQIEIDEINTYLLMEALDIIINSRMIIYNRYGFPCYLKEYNDMLFLDDSITSRPSYSHSAYTSNPIVTVTRTFTSYIDELMYHADLPLVKKCKITKDLSYVTKVLLYETAYALGKLDTPAGKSLVASFPENVIPIGGVKKMSDGTIINALRGLERQGEYGTESPIVKVDGLMKMFVDGKWIPVPKDREIKYVTELSLVKREIVREKGVEMLGKRITKFKLDDKGKLRVIIQNPSDTRAARGRVCTTLNIADILDIFINRLAYIPPHRTEFDTPAQEKASVRKQTLEGIKDILKSNPEFPQPDLIKSIDKIAKKSGSGAGAGDSAEKVLASKKLSKEDRDVLNLALDMSELLNDNRTVLCGKLKECYENGKCQEEELVIDEEEED